MVSRRTAIILTVVLALLIVAMFVGAAVFLRSARMAQTHLIPDGYTGWVSVNYGVDEAPPLPIEDGHLLFRYDARGTLETSTDYEEGWSVNDYFYDAGATRHPLRQRPPGFDGRIWSNYTMSSMVSQVEGETIRTGVSTGFFVGTEEQYGEVSGPGFGPIPSLPVPGSR